MQNITLQKKYQFKAIFASFATTPEQMRQPKDMMSLLVAFGAQEKQAKQMVASEVTSVHH
jgi:RNase P/RNase MRP subunit p30